VLSFSLLLSVFRSALCSLQIRRRSRRDQIGETQTKRRWRFLFAAGTRVTTWCKSADVASKSHPGPGLPAASRHDSKPVRTSFPEHVVSWVSTKGPSRWNQRLGTIHGGGWGGQGSRCGWVPDPPGHTRPDYALENESPAGRGAGGCQAVPTGTLSPACTALWRPDRPPSSGLDREGTPGGYVSTAHTGCR
jgi:hypothetical protein